MHAPENCDGLWSPMAEEGGEAHVRMHAPDTYGMLLLPAQASQARTSTRAKQTDTAKRSAMAELVAAKAARAQRSDAQRRCARTSQPPAALSLCLNDADSCPPAQHGQHQPISSQRCMVWLL